MNRLSKVIAQLKKYTNPDVVKDIRRVIKNQKLNIGIDEFPTPDVNWEELSFRLGLSENFIREFADKVDWESISQNRRLDLSEDFIREFADKLDWGWLSRRKEFSEDIIKEFANRFNEGDWEEISIHQKLSEDFIREFADKVDWEAISEYQYMSENFIREFADKVDWNGILANRRPSDFSSGFLEEFGEFLESPPEKEEEDWDKIMEKYKNYKTDWK